MNTNTNSIWNRAYKIPWDDPDFSRRMLNEHLSQDHDMASRRSEWIDKQVTWIHEHLLQAKPSSILDLGCGPGFYSHRLAKLGHDCRGIDFGPASIEYALRHRPDESVCDFALCDIRQVEFGGPYDLVMLLFGEVNVFSPAEVSKILQEACASCRLGGQMIVEAATPACVEAVGTAEASEYECKSGLFSDRPHSCRTENQWLAEEQVAIQTFTVTETGNGQSQLYRSTTKAWPDDELGDLLTEAGFATALQCEAWPSNTDAMRLWIARKR
ncbi:MAG TPA: methyltransferase domain-containing protein [Phycisphaerae bacterium]|nr:methyltransferase domain-containing protein [Phycisphaerae bacterium]